MTTDFSAYPETCPECGAHLDDDGDCPECGWPDAD